MSHERNKHGQRLGEKGQRTRLRLMACGRDLLDRQSPLDLTAVAIAKAAGVSIASFYLYFDDVLDLLYELGCVAGSDIAGLERVVREEWAGGAAPNANARRVVDAFLAVWDAHRPVLLYRNLEADRGDPRFAELRIASYTPLIAVLGERIYRAGLPKRRCSRGDARAEALIFVTAMDGYAAADPARSEREFGIERISRVLAQLIARSMAP